MKIFLVNHVNFFDREKVFKQVTFYNLFIGFDYRTFSMEKNRRIK